MKYLASIALALMLTACGGDNGGDDAPDQQDAQMSDDLTVFEGESAVLEVFSTNGSIQWQQVSGPEFDIAQAQQARIVVTVPWITGPSQDAVFAVTVTSDEVIYSGEVTVTVHNRRYLLAAQDGEVGDLWLKYLAENADIGAFANAPINLTQMDSGQAGCDLVISPTGRHLAYGMRTGSIISPCQGLWILDLQTGLIENPVAEENVMGHSWSPNGEWLAFAIQGEELNWFVLNGVSGDVQWVNRFFQTSTWPTQAVSPGLAVDNAGIPNVQPWIQWLANSRGFSFRSETMGDFDVYLSSIFGGPEIFVRPVGNSIAVVPSHCVDVDEDQPLPVDDEDYCTVGEPDEAVGLGRPHWWGSSPSGHFAMVADIHFEDGQDRRIFHRAPVVDGEAKGIMGEFGMSAGEARWSPVANDLAFTSSNNWSFAFQNEQVVTASDYRNELYIHENVTVPVSQHRQRLSRVDAAIDDNPVETLAWADDGNAIVYARGDYNFEIGYYLKSLWTAQVSEMTAGDDASIAAHTQLIDSFPTTIEGDRYSSGMYLAPNNGGVMYKEVFVGESAGHTTLKFAQLDGSGKFDLLTHDGDSSFDLDDLIVSSPFSTDGQYLALLHRSWDGIEMEHTSNIEVVTLATGSTAVLPGMGEGFNLRSLDWAPNNQSLGYSLLDEEGAKTGYLTSATGDVTTPFSQLFFEEFALEEYWFH